MATKKIDLGTLRDRELKKLGRDNAKLRAICIVTLERLSRMTTEQFSLGADKPLREMLAKVIEQTK